MRGRATTLAVLALAVGVACGGAGRVPPPTAAAPVASDGDAGASDAGADAAVVAEPDRTPPRAKVIDLATASGMACALHDGGLVSCWGEGWRSKPERVLGLEQVVQIAGGARGAIYARTRTGDVYGIHGRSAVPLRLALARAALEISESCAVLDDGQVSCWNYDQKIGIVRGLTHATHVGSSMEAGCASHDGIVTCWTPRVAFPDVKIADVEEIAVANDRFHCARTKSGDVQCWGERVPAATAMPVSTGIPIGPLALGLRDAVGLSTDGGSVCVVRRDHSTLCLDARFARGTFSSHPGGVDAELLRLGRGYRCALLAGAVTCSGSNEQGQLGNGVDAFDPRPSTVSGIADAVAVHAGREWTCALRAKGKVSCWGRVDGETSTATPFDVTGLAPVVELGGNLFPCFRTADGRVGCTSASIRGPIGWAPVTKSEGFSVVFAGCSVTAGALSCWGGNRAGQYGDGSSGEPPAKGPGAAGVTDATSVAMGSYHACLVRRGGEVLAFGDDLADDTLGDAHAGLVLTPRPVPGTHPSVAVAAGMSHCCALRTDGLVDCFGRAVEGELGDGSRTTRGTAAPVVGVEHATQLAAASMSTCAVVADGRVFCWGKASRGQLGPAFTGDSSARPVEIAGLRDRTSVSPAESHACAVGKDGTVACWGGTLEGQTGTVVSGRFATPQRVAFPP